MLITFSSPAKAGITRPGNAAHKIEPVLLSVDWKHASQCRLKLLSLPSERAAGTRAHEAFIRAVFDQDPGATVKTARAIYRGQADYLKQTA